MFLISKMDIILEVFLILVVHESVFLPNIVKKVTLTPNKFYILERLSITIKKVNMNFIVEENSLS